MRSHHDYIESDSFIAFIESIKHLNYDVDIMIEAKELDSKVEFNDLVRLDIAEKVIKDEK